MILPKDLPVVTVENGTVKVNAGSVEHPMIPEHFIERVYVQTENGGQRKALKPGNAGRCQLYFFCTVWKK